MSVVVGYPGRPEPAVWLNSGGLPPRRWTCGHCGRATGNDKGYNTQDQRWQIYLCPACGRPTFFQGDRQVPGAAFGNSVDHLPGDLGPLYQEARNCMVVSAYTAAVLTCRKMLMHIAVEKGAPPDKTFQFYVGYLVDGKILPTSFQTWVDAIRQRGNEANHEITVMGQKDANDILSFTEMLLKVLYEYPYRAAAPAGP
jgi:hypothetical protein